ncbi:hypothetical protein HZA96_01755 [Candidatus Woesearchaeota archaeon]|nr:hypothetical protein [Candidatus Woesearchaeota archaeon]
MHSRKKAQVTVFIILGLLLVVTIGLTLTIKEIANQKAERYIPITDSITPLETYVKSCLQDIAKKEVQTIALQGLSFEPDVFIYYNNTKVNYLCLQQDNECINRYITKQEIGQRIAKIISNKIQDCVDLNIFKNQGFVVSTGEISAKITITPSKVIANLAYPIQLKKETKQLDAEDYGAEINLPFGQLFALATSITNKEIEDNYFDSIDFMKSSSDMQIQKIKVYPDTIYILSKNNFQLQFAIQGKETVKDAVFSQFGNPTLTNGCCYNAYDNSCNKNTEKNICEQKQGIYDSSPTCSCENPAPTNIELCNGKPCKNCAVYAAINGKKTAGVKKHLESWCVYDENNLNLNNIDMVGSRSSVHYCFNGKEQIEECRDYREEFCVEKPEINNKQKTTAAQCKVNRWQDCNSCATEECCENAEKRDCQWLESIATEQKCIPLVKPGFKFWEGNGISTCLQANEKKECNGLSCDQQWIDDSSKLCASVGDCGNYYNMKKQYTLAGYYNTDFLKKAKIIDNSGSATINVKQKKILSGELYKKRIMSELQQFSVQSNIDKQSQIITALLTYFEKINSISLSDFLNPFREKPVLHVLDVSFCSVWDAPLINNCELCQKDALYSCSEYRCKSLGKSCLYDYNKGNPVCFKAETGNLQPFITNVAISPSAYNLLSDEIKLNDSSIFGYAIQPRLKPYQLITLTIETNKETTCKLDFTPIKKYSDASSFYLGDMTYGKVHNITLRVPQQMQIPEKILTLFNVSTIDELNIFLEAPKDAVNNYKQKYSRALELYKAYRGDDLTEQIDPITEKLQQYLMQFDKQAPIAKQLIKTALHKWNNNEYLLYIKCSDKAGNELADQRFIDFSIDAVQDDKESPLILGLQPENNSFIASGKEKQDIIIYTDEPSECKFDSEDKEYINMSYSFNCQQSRYATASFSSGSYPCATTLSIAKDPETIFIRCRDNPEKKEVYSFTLKTSAVAEINGIKQNTYINITPNNILTFSLNMLLNKNIIFSVNNESLGNEGNEINNEITVQIYKDDNKNCNITDYYEHSVKIQHCEKTQQPELGLYKCSEKFNLNEFFHNSFNENSSDNVYNLLIACSDDAVQQNINENSYLYILKQSAPLNIIDYEPKEELSQNTANIIITTTKSKDIKCNIRRELALSGEQMKMQSSDKFSYAAKLSKGYTVFAVSCKDAFGNIAEKDIGILFANSLRSFSK